MSFEKFNEIEELLKNVFDQAGITPYLRTLPKVRLIKLLEEILLEENEISDSINIEEYHRFLDVIRLEGKDNELLRINKRELVSNFLRIFHVLFTSVIGISLGLSTYIILGMSFEAASTLFIGMNAVLLGSLAGLGFVKAMQYESDAIRHKIRLNRLREIVLKFVLNNIENEIKESQESINALLNRFANQNIVMFESGINYFTYFPQKRRLRFDLNKVKDDLKDEFIEHVKQLAIISEEIEAQYGFSPLRDTDFIAKVNAKELLKNRLLSPIKGFWDWFKKNKTFVLSNAAGVTLGNFAGYFVIPGILLLVGKAMAFYTMVGILLGPLGVFLTIGIISVLTILNTCFFVYSQYKNSVRSDLLTLTNTAVLQAHCINTNKGTLLHNLSRLKYLLTAIYKIYELSSVSGDSARPIPSYIPDKAIIAQHPFLVNSGLCPELNDNSNHDNSSLSPVHSPR